MDGGLEPQTSGDVYGGGASDVLSEVEKGCLVGSIMVF